LARAQKVHSPDAAISHSPPSLPAKQYDFKGSPIAGFYLDYQRQQWQYRIGYSQLRFNREYPTLQPAVDGIALASTVSIRSGCRAICRRCIDGRIKNTVFLSAGVTYDSGPLQVQLALSRLQSQSLYLAGSLRRAI